MVEYLEWEFENEDQATGTKIRWELDISDKLSKVMSSDDDKPFCEKE